jgi:hypothetical protein
MLVIGGRDPAGGYLNDVWQLDLAAAAPAWTLVATAGTPPAPRETRGALYDPVRDRVLLFGGFGVAGHFNDTWALDLSGTPTWHPLTPSGTLPAPRRAMSLVYDPVGDRLLVFGGYDQVQFMNDLWALSLSGAPAWQPLTPSGSPPPPRYGHTATYDPVRHEMVVFGGYNGAFLSDMYVLSLAGAPAWSSAASSPRPSLRDFHTMAWDPPRSRMVLIGGNNSGGAQRDVWTLDPSTRGWSDVTPGGAASWPPARLGTFAPYDPPGDRLVLFGGYSGALLNDTWALGLGGAEPVWTPLAQAGPRPSPRVWHGEVYDPVRRRLLVIGGLDPSGGYLNDVWQLDLSSNAAQWSQVAVQGTPPAAREFQGALYDPLRDRVLVFGGFGYEVHFNDTWSLELSGTPTWQELSPAGPKPAPRRAMSMVYDPVGDRMLVFGGYDQVDFMNDLWVLKLGGPPVWQRLQAVGPLAAPRFGASATYDPVRRQLFVFGGYNGMSLFSGQFLADGFVLPLDHPLEWSPIAPAGPAPTGRDFHAVAYDAARDRFVLYSGNNAGAIGDLWTLSYAAAARAPGAGALGRPRPGTDGAVAFGAREEAYAFALDGFVPNPARGGFQVSFSLPDATPARLELFDLAGRLVRARTLDAPRPGRQWSGFDRSSTLPPGVYVVRLTQGARSVSVRGAVAQ